eukprot:543585-Rhodomonas_salina.1
MTAEDVALRNACRLERCGIQSFLGSVTVACGVKFSSETELDRIRQRDLRARCLRKFREAVSIAVREGHSGGRV